MNSVKLKRQLTMERWSALIKESKESSLLLKDWLRENNISKDQYYYWKRKINDEHASAFSNSFVEVSANVINETKLPDISDKKDITSPLTDLSTVNNTTVASIKTETYSIDIYANINPSMLMQLLEVVKHV